jgi:serine phosphatase RsbU (regulator of sigma subunit)
MSSLYMKKNTLILIICFLKLLSTSQTKLKIDSLLNQLDKVKTDTQKIHCYVDLSAELRNTDLEGAHKYATLALELAENCEYPWYKATANFRYGSTLWKLGKNIEALEYSQKALLIFEGLGDEKGKMKCYLTIGNSFSNSNIKKAEEFYIKALKIAEKIDDKFTIAATYGNIGAINSDNQQSGVAISYTQKSAEIFKKIGDEHGYNLMLVNNANNYLMEKKYQLALSELNQPLSFYKGESDFKQIIKCYNIKQECFNKLNRIDSLNRLQVQINKVLNENLSYTERINGYYLKVRYFEYCNNVDSAQFYHDKCLVLGKATNDDETLIYILEMYGSFSQNYSLGAQKTIDLYDQVIEVAKRLNSYQYLWNAYYFKGINLKKLKRFDEAAFALEESMNIKDTLDKINANQKLAGLLESHKMDEMESSYKEAESQNQIKKKELEKATLQRYSLTGGLLIVGAMMLFVYRNFKRKKRDNAVLEEQKKEIEEKNVELNRAGAIIAEKNKSIIDSINYAQKIQQSTLTSKDYLTEMFNEHFVFYKPKDILSGDFYWAYNKPGTSLFLWAVGDCTGHGVPGALMSMLGNMFLNEIIIENEIIEPNKILDKLRDKIILALDSKNSGQRDGMDIAICALDKKTNQLQFAGANNSAWIVRNGELVIVQGDKMPIGIDDAMKPFSLKTYLTLEGDTIYLSTDGYSDQFGGANGKKFKSSNFKEFVISLSKEPIKHQRLLIEENFVKWKSIHEQTDDVCVLCVKIK